MLIVVGGVVIVLMLVMSDDVGKCEMVFGGGFVML